jgi:hypothetical protein
MPSLEDLLQKFIGQKRLRFEGDNGVESLEKIATVLGYKRSGFRFGEIVEVFLSDNPGAQEAIVNWICEQNIKEWKDKLQEEVGCDNIIVTFPTEEALEDASERISYEEKDRLEKTLEIEPEELTPEFREEFRQLGAEFSDEEDDDQPGDGDNVYPPGHPLEGEIA